MASLQNPRARKSSVLRAAIVPAALTATSHSKAKKPTKCSEEEENPTESSEDGDEVDIDEMEGEGPQKAEEERLNAYVNALQTFKVPVKTGLKGINVIHDPLYNKGSGFPHIERDRLGMLRTDPSDPFMETDLPMTVFLRFARFGAAAPTYCGNAARQNV
jgi:hypothetical protein